MHRPLAAIFCAVLAGCASSAPTPPPHHSVLWPVAQLAGEWTNTRQMSAAPDDLKRPPAAGALYPWLDQQQAVFFAVDAPAMTQLGSQAMYLVWRSSDETGPISRQRLWIFRSKSDGTLVMDFYAFKNPQAFAAAAPGTVAFAHLKAEDLVSYGDACSLPVQQLARGWQASIPDTCLITARSGRKMRLSATIVLEGDRLAYQEQGTLETGDIAFKVPGGPAYVFDRKGRN
jgi:hypothetical protein